MLDFIVNYWFILFALLVIVFLAGYFVRDFLKKPTTEQLASVREWLLLAVTEAEKEFGSGTGQIKLRSVYDKFLTKFPALVNVITFTRFSELVDEALDTFKTMLKTNKAVSEYVSGGDE